MTLVLHHLQWKTLVSDHLHDLEIESVPAPVHLDATEKVVSLVSQGVKYVQKCSLIIKYC